MARIQNDGWVKLYRQINDNDLLSMDNTSFIVFVRLLTVVNRETGSWRTGRYKLAEFTNLKPSTAWSALLRLEGRQMVTLSTDSRSTLISICNWREYQQPVDSKSTARRQPVDTKQEAKNKEDSITNVILGDEVKDKIGRVYYEAVKALNLPIKNHNNLRQKIVELSKDKDPEKIIKYLEFMRDRYAALDIPYKPHINEALDLYSKRVQIKNAIESAVKEQSQPNVWRPKK